MPRTMKPKWDTEVNDTSLMRSFWPFAASPPQIMEITARTRIVGRTIAVAPGRKDTAMMIMP